MSKHTAGPYLRDGRFVYASTMYALPSGKPMEVNRFSASVSPGHECSQDEAEAVARLFAAAPELLEALESVLDALGALGNRHELNNRLSSNECQQVWAAYDKAIGES